MVCTPTRPRVMILGEGDSFLRLTALFESHPALAAWEAVVTQSVEQARFFMQMQACDALVVDQSALGSLDDNVLGWLVGRETIPLLFLSSADPVLLEHALAQG